MRVSTNTIYDQSSSKLSDLQSKMNTTQAQISAQKRILTPSDDPVASARVLEVTQSQSVNAQFVINRQYAKDSLVSVDSALSSVTDLLQDVKTLAISAGNPNLSDANRAAMATTVRARMSELVGLANATDGTGKYLFAGYHTTTAPFVVQAANTGLMIALLSRHRNNDAGHTRVLFPVLVRRHSRLKKWDTRDFE